VLLYFLGIPGPASYSRFRVPAEPLLALFAAAGVWRLLALRRLQKSNASESPSPASMTDQ